MLSSGCPWVFSFNKEFQLLKKHVPVVTVTSPPSKDCWLQAHLLWWEKGSGEKNSSYPFETCMELCSWNRASSSFQITTKDSVSKKSSLSNNRNWLRAKEDKHSYIIGQFGCKYWHFLKISPFKISLLSRHSSNCLPCTEESSTFRAAGQRRKISMLSDLCGKMLSQAEWKTHSSTGGLLWKQESSVISWLWPSGFMFQLSLGSKLVCIWSQKPQTALQLFSFQGREGQGVNSTFGCLWSFFDHRRDNEDKSCTPIHQIILTNKLRLLLPGNYQPWKNARCWGFIYRNPPSPWTVLH